MSVVSFWIPPIKSFLTEWWPKPWSGVPGRRTSARNVAASEAVFRVLHPLIRMVAHLSCRSGLRLWAACWCPSLCLHHFPQQPRVIISGIFETAFPFSVSELLHAAFFFSVEFNSLSCFLIRKIYRIHSNFLEINRSKKSFPGILTQLWQMFHLLISPLNSCWSC